MIKSFKQFSVCMTVLGLTTNMAFALDLSKPFSKGGAFSIDKPFDKGGSLSIDKPVDKGGALSIDKPVDKGGALSIDKPFDKGGALSIDKVYVPPKLRIGKVQSLAEVIIPVCWGSPQDCRGTPDLKTAPEEADKVVNKTYPYYITVRYECSSVETRKRSGRTCDVTKASSKSCEEARDAVASHVAEVGDPCTRCSEITDNSAYWDGATPEHIQYGGMCAGW